MNITIEKGGIEEMAYWAAKAAVTTGPPAVQELGELLHEFALHWKTTLLAAKAYDTTQGTNEE